MARRFGKVDREFLGRVLLKNTGAANAKVLVGPGLGLDNAVLSVAPGRVMVVTADPLSIIPALGMKLSAWLSIHELASDLATSAIRPEFAVLDYNLPQSLEPRDFRRYTEALSDECARLGVAIIGGHTGRYPGAEFTVVGGGMLMGTGEEAGYLTPAMARGGDEVLMTKSAALEATAVLAHSFPSKVRDALGRHVAGRAMDLIHSCSTVEDSLTAASSGIRSEGVTSMHDATEGGVLGGLFEMAKASGRDLRVDHEMISLSEECMEVCGLFGLDPFVTLGEGSLLLTCTPGRSPEVMRRLSKGGLKPKKIGVVGEKGGRLLITRRGVEGVYTPPRDDPYWRAYAGGVANGWK